MTRMSTLNDLLASIIDRGARLVDRGGAKPTGGASIEDLCARLMGAKGEASGVTLAAQILARYDALEPPARDDFFRLLAERYEIDAEAAAEAALAYRDHPSPAALEALVQASEPPRQELLRRLNFAPDGARRLVAMRADLLQALPDNPEFERIDNSFRHLLTSWFNRGFLVLRPVDWSSPADVLEKIIAYEAVHEIDSWDELRRRLQPADRRCFAFFHPSMPDEPLIFVEVALTGEIADSVQEVLKPGREIVSPAEATTAVFYSISNCQIGLRGVSFGSFLIKQVAQDLARALPNITTFVTLSPVPGFGRWLRGRAQEDAESRAGRAAALTRDLGWPRDPAAVESAKPLILGLAAEYLLEAKRPDGQPVDPVARFHLGNGASLARVNWLADVSARGLTQSTGVMVNYLYELGEVEAHHEAYAEQRAIRAARQVRALLPAPKK